MCLYKYRAPHRYILRINVNASEEITRYKYAQLKPQVTRVTFTSVSPMKQKTCSSRRNDKTGARLIALVRFQRISKIPSANRIRRLHAR